MTFVSSTRLPRGGIVTTTTKEPFLEYNNNDEDDYDDTITSLPPIQNKKFHPLFNKRHIFPLTLSPTFDWFFDTLPAHFKERYQSCIESSPNNDDDSVLEALDTFFWEASQNFNEPRHSCQIIYHVTIQASIFDSFVEEMEKFCSTTTRKGAFVLPITRICGDLMEWGRPYNIDDFPHEDVNETFHTYHRHLFIAVQHGYHFMDQCLNKIRASPYVRGCTFPLPLMLKLKAFNSVPPTQLLDLLKVCSVRQLYDDGQYNKSVLTDTYMGDYIMERFNMPPVHRVDSF